MGAFWIVVVIAVVGLVAWWWSSHKNSTDIIGDATKDVNEAVTLAKQKASEVVDKVSKK